MTNDRVQGFEHDQMLVKTQHLLGASTFTRVDESTATGDWQVRANHIKTLQDGSISVWENSAYSELTYIQIEGEWKLHAWRPHTVTSEIGSFAETIGKP